MPALLILGAAFSPGNSQNYVKEAYPPPQQHVFYAFLPHLSASVDGLLPCPPSKFGIHTMLQDYPVSEIRAHLDLAKELVGECGLVKYIVADIGVNGKNPDLAKAAEFVRQAYQRNLVPVLRMQGHLQRQAWQKPARDYSQTGQMYAEALLQIQKLSGHKVPYIQLWNEPNLAGEWGGSPNAAEYSSFHVATGKAIRKSSPGTKLTNAPLAMTEGTPDGLNINTFRFIDDMFTAEPTLADYIDVLAVNEYARSAGCLGMKENEAECLGGYRLQLANIAKHFQAAGLDVPKVMIMEASPSIVSSSWEAGPTIQASFTPEQFTRFYMQLLNDSRVEGIIPFSLTAGKRGEWQGFAWADSSLRPGAYFRAVSSLRTRWQAHLKDGSSGAP